MSTSVHDATPCILGEGPLWHPTRGQLFWFDIIGQRLHTHGQCWDFDQIVSAAGWVDDARLLIASATGLLLFDLTTGTSDSVAPLEADRPNTRTNDGRADPYGGFWIGTMSKAADPRQGTIYRFYRGEVRALFPEVTIPNGIAFSTDGSTAYFADTRKHTVWTTHLDSNGWPTGEPQVFRKDPTINPDGAVVDAYGNYWSAEWGGSRVASYDPSGQLRETVSFGAPHTSCPAFGGPDLSDLYCTTAQEHLTAEQRADGRPHGVTFVAPGVGKGQAEHRVLL
ncbi:MAG: SMP-30/gluconolactonase/LRE family protein [Pseudomonadota bacterium]